MCTPAVLLLIAGGPTRRTFWQSLPQSIHFELHPSRYSGVTAPFKRPCPQTCRVKGSHHEGIGGGADVDQNRRCKPGRAACQLDPCAHRHVESDRARPPAFAQTEIQHHLPRAYICKTQSTLVGNNVAVWGHPVKESTFIRSQAWPAPKCGILWDDGHQREVRDEGGRLRGAGTTIACCYAPGKWNTHALFWGRARGRGTASNPQALHSVSRSAAIVRWLSPALFFLLRFCLWNLECLHWTDTMWSTNLVICVFDLVEVDAVSFGCCWTFLSLGCRMG